MNLRIAMTITSRTALSVGAGGSAGSLADKSIVRDGWGRPIIPGSQVKGKLRFAAERLLRGLGQDIPTPFEGKAREEHDTLVRRLFGSPEQRSPLYFADLPGVLGALDQIDALRTGAEQYRSHIRPSVAINRHRGTAADQLLLLQEAALEQTRFHAARAITGSVNSLGDAALLVAAARLTPRWGGASSRGLGWATVELQVTLDDTVHDEAALSAALREVLAAEMNR